jgi:integrase
MPRRRKLTDRQIAELPIKTKRYIVPDPELGGHYIRIYPSGAKSFVTVKDNVWEKIGDARLLPIEKAREEAKRILRGDKTSDAFEAVVREYSKQHVDNLRSEREVKRHLDRLVAEFEGRTFDSIKRGEILALAQRTADAHGNYAAKYLVATFSHLSKWYALRHDDYASPVVAGMGKSYRTEARARILSDDELRAIWRACDDGHPTFGAMVKVLLLTSARREKVSTMKWSDIDDRGVWNIPRVKGEKANAGSLPLPPLALDIIRSRPRIDGNPFVFASTHAHLRSFSKLKAELDAKSGVRGWRLHDLRRTARSLPACDPT